MMTPFIAVGVPLLVLGLALFIAPGYQRVSSVEVWGIIVAITSAHQHVAAAAFPPVSTSMWLPVVEFETEEGQAVTATLAHGAVSKCAIGERIRLRYYRRMPDRIFVPTPFEWIIPAGVVALGVLCILISLAGR